MRREKGVKIKIENYTGGYDTDLIELFYRSIYYNRKEFETVRVPDNWINRYQIYNNSITKIAIHKGKIIGSLGVLPGKCKVDGKIINVGCFVDNCILPEYLDNYENIFSELFFNAEKDMIEQGMDVICGWNYLKHVNKHSKFFKNLDFTWIEGINWFAGGFDFKGEYPKKWDGHMPFYWRPMFRFVNYYYRIKSGFIHHLPQDVHLRTMQTQDIEKILKFSEKLYEGVEFAPSYTIREFSDIIANNNIHGIIAEKNSEIIGVLTYITTAWSGWMFGKPYYNNKWRTFFTFTPDEFIVTPEYQNTSIPVNMILELMKIKNPEEPIEHRKGYSFIDDIFDRKIHWRMDALSKSGCIEAKADYGVILAKSLRDDIELDTNKIWHLPARYIVAPVPSSSYFQKSGQQGV